MRKIIIALTFLFTTPLMAAERGLYGGAELTSSTIDTGITAGTANLDEDGTGYRLFIGNKISDTLSFEAFYADFGEAALSGNTGDTFFIGGSGFQFLVDNAKIAISATGFGVNANFIHNFNKKSSLTGRLGIMAWDSELTVSGSNIAGGTVSTSGSDILYGIGYQHKFTKKIGLAVGYDVFNIEDDDIKTLSVGVTVNF